MDDHLGLEIATKLYAYHKDSLGNIINITDSAQITVNTYSYDSFGNVTQTGTLVQPYAFTGREWDKETGLYYYRARYYDPSIGRFIQKDPIGFDGGDMVLYGYVQDNPINLTDPSGLVPPNVVYPGVNIAANIEEARHRMDIFDFINAVKAGGKWDFKKYGAKYEDFGNYHFGIVANAFGFDEEFALRGAGAYQNLTDLKRILKGKKPIGKGCFLGGEPYGDDSNDQRWIKEGFYDY